MTKAEKFYTLDNPEFWEFIGATKEQVEEKYSYADYEDFPGIKKRGMIRSMGGTVRFPGAEIQDYKWTYQVVRPSENFLEGELFVGYGKTRNEAALSGIKIMWEMWHRRFNNPL